ncbi:MAG: fatty acid desaturase [FCB group bacterium]|jgi:omega-6 fatty acid desaturase (delta-12 desaturase)
MKNPEWLTNVKKFEKPEIKKSVFQMLDSIIPFVALLVCMFVMMDHGVSYWLVMPLIILTSCFMVRIFIIMHDCSHFSYFRSKQACNIVGFLSGLIIFMPFYEFQHSHAIHHATSGILEKRGIGDVWTLTVEEYRTMGKFKKFICNGFRSPYTFLTIGPLVQFLYISRMPSISSKKKQVFHIFLVDGFMLLTMAIAYFTNQFGHYLLILAPMFFIAQDVGIILFFVQHQFEDVQWTDNNHWDPIKVALSGSSFYKLPRVLQWITGNIGFHHIHHLKPGIPNYKLNQCFNEIPELRNIKPVKMFEGFKGLSYKLWDDESGSMVKISNTRKMPQFVTK